MNNKIVAQNLLLLFVLALVVTVLANQFPGAWWQWAIVSAILFVSAAIASTGSDDA